MYKLIIEDDEGHTTVVPLVKSEITIGRKEGNTIRLTERNVSRHHARLIKSNGSVFIEDLDSYNGVKVNGDRISARTTIREGDLVEIGDYHFALQWIGEDAGEAPRPLIPSAAETPPPLASAQAKAAATPVQTPAAVMKIPVDTKKEAETARARVISEGDAGRLLVLNTELAGSEFTLNSTEMVLGRVEEGDIFLNHRSVSNRHAKIVFDGGIYRILDLDSANGVLVNGEEYSRVDLRRGDIIELGHVKIRYVAPGEDFQAIPETEAVEDGPTLTAVEPKGAAVGKAPSRRRIGPMVVAVLAVVLVGLGVYYYVTRDKGTATTETDTAAKTSEPAEEPVAEAEDPAAGRFKEGHQKLGERDFDGAIAAFKDALDKNPDYPGAANELARAKREKHNSIMLARAKNSLAKKDLEGAMEAINNIPANSIFAKEVAELKPRIQEKYVSSNLVKAATLKDKGDLDKAKKYVRAVLVVDENNKAAKDLLRNINKLLAAKRTVAARVTTPPRKEGTSAAAKLAKKEQIKRNKKEAKELTRKAKKLIAEKKFEPAVPVAMKIIRLDPRNCDGYLIAGIAHASAGRREKAAKYYQKFVDICPRSPRAPAVREALRKFHDYKKQNR